MRKLLLVIMTITLSHVQLYAQVQSSSDTILGDLVVNDTVKAAAVLIYGLQDSAQVDTLLSDTNQVFRIIGATEDGEIIPYTVSQLDKLIKDKLPTEPNPCLFDSQTGMYRGHDWQLRPGSNHARLYTHACQNFRVGIGTHSPIDDFHVNVSSLFTSSLEVNTTSNVSFKVTDSSQDDVFRIYNTGEVWATEYHADVKADFPDYVFMPGYKLMSLEDLRTYLKRNRHLPNIPSADQVNDEGIDLVEMQRLQLEKIEELTLYILQLEERLKQLEAKN